MKKILFLFVLFALPFFSLSYGEEESPQERWKALNSLVVLGYQAGQYRELRLSCKLKNRGSHSVEFILSL